MTAEMTAEGLPILPEAVGGEPVSEGTPEEEKRRRRKKALLLLLLGLLAMLITIAIWYLLFRQPIAPLPSRSSRDRSSRATRHRDLRRRPGRPASRSARRETGST